jgi:hypothetical protein
MHPIIVYALCTNYSLPPRPPPYAEDRQAKFRIFKTSYINFFYSKIYILMYNVHCIAYILGPSFNFFYSSGLEINQDPRPMDLKI